MEMPTHAYCNFCGAIQPVEVGALERADASGRFRGGDMLCAVCGWIICTLYKPVEAVEEPKPLLETPSLGRKPD
jgi:hypothetical protein